MGAPSAIPEILTNTFSQGLREGGFCQLFAKKPPQNYDELFSWAKKYIHMEEAQKAKQEQHSTRLVECIECQLEHQIPSQSIVLTLFALHPFVGIQEESSINL